MTPFISTTEVQQLTNEERLAYADYVSDYLEQNPADYKMFLDSTFE